MTEKHSVFKVESILKQLRCEPLVDLTKFTHEDDKLLYEAVLKLKRNQRSTRKLVQLPRESPRKARIHAVKSKVTKRGTTPDGPRARYRTRRSTRLKQLQEDRSIDEAAPRIERDSKLARSAYVDLDKFSSEEDRVMFENFTKKKKLFDQVCAEFVSSRSTDSSASSNTQLQLESTDSVSNSSSGQPPPGSADGSGYSNFTTRLVSVETYPRPDFNRVEQLVYVNKEMDSTGVDESHAVPMESSARIDQGQVDGSQTTPGEVSSMVEENQLVCAGKNDSAMYETAGEQAISKQLVSELTGQIKKLERTRLEIDLDPEKNKIKIWFDNDREQVTKEELVRSEGVALEKFASEVERTQVQVDYDLADNKIDVWYRNRRETETGEEVSRELCSSVNASRLSLAAPPSDSFSLHPDVPKRTNPMSHRKRLSDRLLMPSRDQDANPARRVSFSDQRQYASPRASSTPYLRRLQTPARKKVTVTEGAPTPVNRRLSQKFSVQDQSQSIPQVDKQCEVTSLKIDFHVALRLITYLALFAYGIYKLVKCLLL